MGAKFTLPVMAASRSGSAAIARERATGEFEGHATYLSTDDFSCKRWNVRSWLTLDIRTYFYPHELKDPAHLAVDSVLSVGSWCNLT